MAIWHGREMNKARELQLYHAEPLDEPAVSVPVCHSDKMNATLDLLIKTITELISWSFHVLGYASSAEHGIDSEESALWTTHHGIGPASRWIVCKST